MTFPSTNSRKLNQVTDTIVVGNETGASPATGKCCTHTRWLTPCFSLANQSVVTKQPIFSSYCLTAKHYGIPIQQNTVSKEMKGLTLGFLRPPVT